MRITGFLFQRFFKVLCFGFLFMLGCTSSDDGAPGPSVFHYNQINNITSLDPAFAKSQNHIWAVDHLYNGLVQLDEQLNIRPAIAKRWEISDSGRVYTFILRDDVYFHDDPLFTNGKGRKVKADDFEYSFNRIISDKVASPGSWIFKGRVEEDVPFKALNDSTFQIRIQTAFRPILGILTMQYCSVVPREVVEHYGRDFRSHPIGTGPFKYKDWIENQTLFLVKNDNYFESNVLPKTDAIRISFINDRKTAYLNLMNQKLDLISGLESSYVNELITIDGDLQEDKKDIIELHKSPYLNTEYLGINLELANSEDHPLNKKAFRQALNYGFDRAKMMETLRNNIGRPADAGFTPRGLPSYDPNVVKGYYYDPAKARTLLTEAGYPNGEGLEPIALFTNKDYQDLCTFIARQWEDLGIKTNIEVVESSTLRQMMVKGQVNLFRASWIADYPDAESFFTVFYSGNPAPPNYTRFSNENFDQLYEAALAENNDSIRYEYYHKMDQILIEESPVIFLFYDETSLFTQTYIKGISKNAINLLTVKGISKH